MFFKVDLVIKIALYSRLRRNLYINFFGNFGNDKLAIGSLEVSSKSSGFLWYLPLGSLF